MAGDTRKSRLWITVIAVRDRLLRCRGAQPARTRLRRRGQRGGAVDRDDREAVVQNGVKSVQLIAGLPGSDLAHRPEHLTGPAAGDEERSPAGRRVGPGETDVAAVILQPYVGR